ncbi:hypothetical protein EVAR_21273_1 [Eumeta japonica]|uniref:Uncharacterized protein n=1 Tax=Eumeta variegata TaxID=151549 RepID=A0A4C1WNP9_EUMVA|nr:hypothetical protein EVAR_21273_1 [Eumeta japonica]
MSLLGCQYVIRTYWTDASTPAVAAGSYGCMARKLDTCRPHGERGEHPRLYKQGHPKGASSSSAAADGEATRRRKQPAARGMLSSAQQRRQRFIQNPIKWRNNRPSHSSSIIRR